MTRKSKGISKMWINRPLTVGMMLLLLPSCSAMFGMNPLVVDPAPAPYFPSCATICDALRPAAPPVVKQDWLHVDNVMLKLRSLQSNDQRETFGPCICAYPVQPGSTPIITQNTPA